MPKTLGQKKWLNCGHMIVRLWVCVVKFVQV
jgi:hypothetical protein